MLSILGVYIGDLRNVWNVCSRLLWFATPIFYLADKTSTIQTINTFNPLFYFIDTTREIVLYHRMPELSYLVSIAVLSILVFMLGLFIFEKFKNRLAEKL